MWSLGEARGSAHSCQQVLILLALLLQKVRQLTQKALLGVGVGVDIGWGQALRLIRGAGQDARGRAGQGSYKRGGGRDEWEGVLAREAWEAWERWREEEEAAEEMGKGGSRSGGGGSSRSWGGVQIGGGGGGEGGEGGDGEGGGRKGGGGREGGQDQGRIGGGVSRFGGGMRVSAVGSGVLMRAYIAGEKESSERHAGHEP